MPIVGLCAHCFALALAAGTPARPVVVESIEVVASSDDDAVERARGVALDRVELERLPARTLAEAMGELPGVVVLFAEPFGGMPMVVARGFFGGGEVDYVGLEVAGAPRAELESGVADWGAIALAHVGRIAYLPGASLRRGGADPALAGLLRIEPRGDAERFTVDLGAGSFASGGASVAVRDPLGDRASLRSSLALDWSTTGGYREHAAAEGYGGAFGVVVPRAAGTFALDVDFRHRDREEPGPLSASELAVDPLASNPLFADDRERADRWGAAVRFERRVGDARLPLTARLDVDGRRSRFLRTLLVAEGYGDRALREIETASEAVGLATPGELAPGRRFAPRAAFDFRNERVGTAYSDPESGAERARLRAKRRRAALELGGALALTDRVELDASLRGDRVDDRASAPDRPARKEALSPRLGLVAAFAPAGGTLELFAEAGKAFKAPTLDQLYDPRPFAAPDGSFTISNPDLAPQKSRGFELGGRFARGALGARLVAYRQIVVDEIDFDPATFRYANIGRSRHQGFELALALRLGAHAALRASWARAEARAEGAEPSGQLKNLPRDVLRAGLSATLPAALELELTGELWRGRFADDANAFRLDDAVRVDLRLARRFGAGGATRVALDLLNALDDDALELAYLLPGAAGGETLHGFAPAPRALRVTLVSAWGGNR